MALSFDMTFDTILSFELCYCVSSLFLIMKKAGKWKWSEHKVLLTCFKPCPQNCEWNIWWLHSLHDLKTIAYPLKNKKKSKYINLFYNCEETIEHINLSDFLIFVHTRGLHNSLPRNFVSVVVSPEYLSQIFSYLVITFHMQNEHRSKWAMGSQIPLALVLPEPLPDYKW